MSGQDEAHILETNGNDRQHVYGVPRAGLGLTNGSYSCGAKARFDHELSASAPRRTRIN